MLPALEAIHDLDAIFEPVENKALLKEMLAPIFRKKREAGMAFYKTLFTQNPEVLPLFGSTDMNFLAGHLFDAIELLVESFNDFGAANTVLHQLGKIHDNAMIPVSAYPSLLTAIDTVFEDLPGYQQESAKIIWRELFTRASLVTSRISFVSEKLIRKALEWSEQVAYELEWDSAFLAQRKIDIVQDIRSTGTYSHLEEEIVHGARVSWRNAAKCVGRIAWNTMLVRDRRHVVDLDHMFAECIEHQRLATADGSLKAVMTVFRPRQPGTRLGVRFWGLQLIRFACYEMEDGSLIGDRANRRYTKECIDFGWKPPEPRTEFDVLPIVIEDTISGTTKMFEVPKEYHKVTMIEHPKFPDLAKLGLRWCVVPTVICFTMTLGGLQYPCCPFNGWFMETEITRDLIEPCRMNKLEEIAKAIGVDSTDEDDFWRERVAHECNKAVVYSFRRDGHSIVDHVTAQSQFLAHDLREKREGRECPAQWSWVVPSSGGATLPVWHHEMRDFYIEPQYQYQAELISLRTLSQVPETDLFHNGDASVDVSFERLLVLFASVTGTAEGYAYKVKKMLRPLHVDVRSCEKVDPKALWKDVVENGGPYSAILFIASTFGEGGTSLAV
jgi:nitric oxide synthase oxygenase domain/subunit/hemoglobin-like flavoprotein